MATPERFLKMEDFILPTYKELPAVEKLKPNESVEYVFEDCNHLQDKYRRDFFRHVYHDLKKKPDDKVLCDAIRHAILCEEDDVAIALIKIAEERKVVVHLGDAQTRMVNSLLLRKSYGLFYWLVSCPEFIPSTIDILHGTEFLKSEYAHAMLVQMRNRGCRIALSDSFTSINFFHFGLDGSKLHGDHIRYSHQAGDCVVCEEKVEKSSGIFTQLAADCKCFVHPKCALEFVRELVKKGDVVCPGCMEEIMPSFVNQVLSAFSDNRRWDVLHNINNRVATKYLTQHPFYQKCPYTYQKKRCSGYRFYNATTRALLKTCSACNR